MAVCDRNGGTCQQFTAQAIREHTGAVFTLPSRGTGLFPRDFSSKTYGTGFVLRRGRSSRCSKWPRSEWAIIADDHVQPNRSNPLSHQGRLIQKPSTPKRGDRSCPPTKD